MDREDLHKEETRGDLGTAMMISRSDRKMVSPLVVLNPNDEVRLPILTLLPTEKLGPDWLISVRSVLGQAGIHANLGDNPEQVLIKNLHPRNSYLIPEGEVALGRIYFRSKESISGAPLEAVAEQINEGNNSLSKEGKIRVVKNELIVPIVPDYWQIPGAFKVGEPIDISRLPSGSKRWAVKNHLGTRGSHEVAGREFPQSGFRLLVTPLVSIPSGITLEITNPDHVSSRIIDGGFEHMIVGEFSDQLSGFRTTDELHLRAYTTKTF